MDQTATLQANNATPALPFAPASVFFLAAMAVAGTAALLAGAMPLGFSIVIVFLFAGPHNWLEFRYFLARMPAHWGPLRIYFLTAIVGAAAITGLFAALPWMARTQTWDYDTWYFATAVLNSALVLWIAALIWLRGKQVPGRDWFWAWPVGFALVSGVWYFPHAWDLLLVYLHPLVALWFLDRELLRSRPEWRGAYHAFLCSVPGFIAILYWQLSNAPSLRGDDMLSMRITQHAGAGILSGVSSHLLVAAHTFLELLHYGVWIVAIPLIGMRSAPWKLESVPLYKRSRPFRNAICVGMAVGAMAVLALWACFIADYPLTRDVYFTAAMLHVLAEIPFLLRTL